MNDNPDYLGDEPESDERTLDCACCGEDAAVAEWDVETGEMIADRTCEQCGEPLCPDCTSEACCPESNDDF